jgi:hypothetical protein
LNTLLLLEAVEVVTALAAAGVPVVLEQVLGLL